MSLPNIHQQKTETAAPGLEKFVQNRGRLTEIGAGIASEDEYRRFSRQRRLNRNGSGTCRTGQRECGRDAPWPGTRLRVGLFLRGKLPGQQLFV